MDESRFGLQTIRRRRLTARGTKPVGTIQHRFENFYLYGAIAPRTGDGYFLGLPKLNADLFQVFLDAFATARPDTLNVLMVDNSRCHTATDLVVPPTDVLQCQVPVFRCTHRRRSGGTCGQRAALSKPWAAGAAGPQGGTIHRSGLLLTLPRRQVFLALSHATVQFRS